MRRRATHRGTGTLPALPALLALATLPLLAPGCVCAGFLCDDDDDLSLPPAPDDDDSNTDEEVLTQRSCTVVLRHTPEGGSGTVEVAGEFNDWSPAAMDGPDADGAYAIELGPLPPGSYAHKFLRGGTWEGDPPASAYGKWLDGTENRALYVGDCQQPLLQVVSASATPDGVVIARLQLARAADAAPLDPDSVLALVGSDARSDTGGVTVTADAESGVIELRAEGLPPGKHSLRVTARDTTGRAEERPLFVPLWVEQTSFRWEDGLIYFVFTDRFRDGDAGEPGNAAPVDGPEPRANYQGGDLLGVLDALEEGTFADLGANVLWLTPVYENPDRAYLASDGFHGFSGFHGYWPVDPFAVEGKLGDAWTDSEERLQELIAAAHARGIRVLFDLVLNHVHEDHVYRSEHPEWFTGGCVCGTAGCGWEERPRDCWFMPYLPDLDYRNHEVLTRVVDDTLELLRRFDVDGVRIDAAKHMDHVVMRTLSRRLREDFEAGGGAQVYSVGETFTGGDGRGTVMEYVSPDELDGQFDFPLFWTIRSVFAGDAPMRDLEAAMLASRDAYGDAYAAMSPFLGNHDIPRFATEAAGNGQGAWGDTPDLLADGAAFVTQWELVNRQSMAFAFTLTQPGLPLIYYGDELGLAGDGDPDNRRFMPWEGLSGNQEELRARTQALGQLRTQSVALRRGALRPLWADDEVLAYARDAGGGAVAFVVLNKGEGERTVTFAATGVEGIAGRSFIDGLHADRVVTVVDGALTVTLGGWESAVLLGE